MTEQSEKRFRFKKGCNKMHVPIMSPFMSGEEKEFYLNEIKDVRDKLGNSKSSIAHYQLEIYENGYVVSEIIINKL